MPRASPLSRSLSLSLSRSLSPSRARTNRQGHAPHSRVTEAGGGASPQRVADVINAVSLHLPTLSSNQSSVNLTRLRGNTGDITSCLSLPFSLPVL